MDKSGRVVGMLVFAVGIILLLLVLGIAYDMLIGPESRLLLPGGPDGADAVNLGGSAIIILAKIGLLFVMTLAASLIAGRGIQLYLGSKRRADRD